MRATCSVVQPRLWRSAPSSRPMTRARSSSLSPSEKNPASRQSSPGDSGVTPEEIT